MNRVPTPAPEGDELPLHRAVRALPTHEPAADSWARIAAQLAGEQAIAQALPHLPSHEPAADTWAQVAARLDQQAAPAPMVRPLWRRAWPASLSLAATILLLLAVGVGQGWFQRPAEVPRLAAAPPAWVPVPVAALPPASLPNPLEAQGEAFIDAHCTSLPVVCQSGEFQALRAQLTELQRQEQRLRAQSQRLGATPQLVRRQVQVTIRKATVTRELIHLLIS
jgi:hypothetical protein